MFQFWKRKFEDKLLDTMDQVLTALHTVHTEIVVVNRKVNQIMVSQQEFNAKVDALSGVVLGIGANQAALNTVVTNFETVVANLKDQLAASEGSRIDVSALDGVLDQARTVKANGDTILNPAVVTPAPADIPTVPVVETPGPGEVPSVTPVDSIPEVDTDDAEAEAPSEGTSGTETSTEDAPVTETPAVDVPGVSVNAPADTGAPANGTDVTGENPATGGTS